MSIPNEKELRFPTFVDERGALSVCEGENLPFQVRRIYYLYNLGFGVVRGDHGHRRLQQIVICMHGAVRVSLDDGFVRRQFVLDAPSVGLYVPPMMWRKVEGLKDDSVCLILASEPYDTSDYIFDIDDFRTEAQEYRGNVPR